MQALSNIHIISLALNIPGPVAMAALVKWGARVTKIEPPKGDPLFVASPDWYQQLHQDQSVKSLDLKDAASKPAFESLLKQADILVTAGRPASLSRLGLQWKTLQAINPGCSYVAIKSYPDPDADQPGHDLQFQAEFAMLRPPDMPATLYVDMAAAEKVTSQCLAAAMQSRRTGQGVYHEVVLAKVAAELMLPFKHRLTSNHGVLSGQSANYQLYRTKTHWIAVAALEPHFIDKIKKLLELQTLAYKPWQAVFLTQTASYWQSWARQHELPISIVETELPNSPCGKFGNAIPSPDSS